MTDKPRASSLRIVFAAFMDFITVFFLGGFAVGAATGGLTDNGFNLNGAPALILFALIIAYFVILGKFGGGTLWQRILGTN